MGRTDFCFSTKHQEQKLHEGGSVMVHGNYFGDHALFKLKVFQPTEEWRA